MLETSSPTTQMGIFCRSMELFYKIFLDPHVSLKEVDTLVHDSASVSMTSSTSKKAVGLYRPIKVPWRSRLLPFSPKERKSPFVVPSLFKESVSLTWKRLGLKSFLRLGPRRPVFPFLPW